MFVFPRSISVLTLVSFCFLVITPGVALAYGPGVGYDLIPYFFTLAAGVVVAIGSVLIWPVRALIYRLRGPKQASADEVASQAQAAFTQQSAADRVSETSGDGTAPSH